MRRRKPHGPRRTGNLDCSDATAHGRREEASFESQPKINRLVIARLCNGCGCRFKPYRNSRGRCRDCLREYERERRKRRGSTVERGYGRAWQELRRVQLARQPYCAECGATLTDAEIRAALDTRGPFLCTVHANEEVALDEDACAPG